jgi:hypothetical protein
LFTEVTNADFFPNSGYVRAAGASQGLSPEEFANERLLWQIPFTAQTPVGGQGTIVFNAEPASNPQVNEVTLIHSTNPPASGPDPGETVPPALVTYIDAPSITILGAGGEGEFTNPNNAMDVNNDGYASPSDALALINYLNANGPQELTSSNPAASAEGENAVTFYYDTNGDYVISPLDVIGVVNYLNAQSASTLGEGEAPPVLAAEPEVIAMQVDPQTAMRIVAALPSDQTDPVRSVDEAFASNSLLPEAAVESAVPAPDTLDGDVLQGIETLVMDDLAEDVGEAWLEGDLTDDILDALV